MVKKLTISSRLVILLSIYQSLFAKYKKILIKCNMIYTENGLTRLLRFIILLKQTWWLDESRKLSVKWIIRQSVRESCHVVWIS